MKKVVPFLVVVSLFLSACVRETPLLRVDDFKLKTDQLAKKGVPMVRGDQNYLLFGKVSAEERKMELGHYLIIRRRDTERPAMIRVQYLQAGTGSERLVKKKEMSADELVYEFKITGRDYTEQGRLLAWKVELLEEGKVIASKQSYMWK